MEPAQSLFAYAVQEEAARPQGIRYMQADLSRLPDLGEPFDAVVASIVLCDTPEWQRAMEGCVDALASRGTLVFTVNHPCFENLWTT